MSRPHHAERVGDAPKRLDLRLQVGNAGFLGTQVEVERVLDPQQVFLDRGRDGVQQRAVAPGQAAARVRELGFAGNLLLEVEGFAQRIERFVAGGTVGHVVEQRARRRERGFRGRRTEAADVGRRVVEHAPRLARHAGEPFAQRRACRHRAIADGGGHRGGHPQHPACGFVFGDIEQPGGGPRQRRGVGGTRVGPRRNRGVEFVQQRRGLRLAVLAPQLRRGTDACRQRPVEIGLEQRAFRHRRLAAGRTQLV